jgi:hypothetical protein
MQLFFTSANLALKSAAAADRSLLQACDQQHPFFISVWKISGFCAMKSKFLHGMPIALCAFSSLKIERRKFYGGKSKTNKSARTLAAVHGFAEVGNRDGSDDGRLLRQAAEAAMAFLGAARRRGGVHFAEH